jgi:hypothetical protein
MTHLFRFDSEETESNWNNYCDVFIEKYPEYKLSLFKFKKFMIEEPNKDIVLKRLSNMIISFDDTIAINKIYNLLKYIHYDYLVNFTKFIDSSEIYKENNKNNSSDENLYNKTVLIRTIVDAQNFLKIFSKFYDYFINSVQSVYKFNNNENTASEEELMESFIHLYKQIDINVKIYHYDFYLEIINMLKKSVIKIIKAIYNDQAGCCVATPTFNTLDILIGTLRNLRKIIDDIK